MVTILLLCTVVHHQQKMLTIKFCGMMLPILSIGLNHMQQKTYFKTLTKSDKRICLKDYDRERLKDGVDHLLTSANTEAKLVIFFIKPNVYGHCNNCQYLSDDLYNFAL